MPISPIVVQRRHAELGRIRLGHKQGGNGFPVKGTSFRFTSPMERYVRDLAALYGGEPRPWDNDGKAEFEVFTDAKSIPVIVIRGGLSQWMETYQGKTCAHRCDGERGVDGTLCDLNDPAHVEAKPTTHLSVMLPELEATGAWHMVSRGWNAAAEIPAVAELAQFVGDLVPAHLNMVERRSMKDGKTTRFVVPVLDLQIGTARLREIVAEKSGVTTPELAAPAGSSAPALSAADPFGPYLERVAAADSREALVDLWTEMVEASVVGPSSAPTPARDAFVSKFRARADALHIGEEPKAEAQGEPDADGVVDAVLVEEPSTASTGAEVDADVVWQQILKAGGDRDMLLADVEDDVRTFLGGMSSAEASGAELAEYLTDLLGRDTQAGAA